MLTPRPISKHRRHGFTRVAGAAFLWSALAVWASCLLYRAVAKRLEYPDLEDDSFLFTPITVQETHDKGAGAVFRYVFHLADEYGIPSLNAYWYFMQRLFGLEVKYYSLALLALHGINTLLFWVLLKIGLRMSTAAASLAALLFLVYSPQFHAYLWPIAFQHLSVLTGVFLTLILYRQTERHIAEGSPRAFLWQRTTVAVAAFSSLLRITVLLAPFHIILDILGTSSSREEAQKRLRRWAPLFLVYLPFRILSVLRHAEGQAIFVRAPSSSPDAGIPLWAIGLILLPAAALAIYSLFRFLKSAADILPAIRGFVRRSPMVTSMAGVVFALWGLGYVTPWILAFKLCWIPEASLYKTLLWDRWHVVTLPAILNGGTTSAEALSLLALLVFGYACFHTFRERLPFLGWYLVAYLGVARCNARIPSRYYLYLSPLVAVCVATLLVDGCRFLFRKWKSLAPIVTGAAAAGVAGFFIMAHTTTTQKRIALSHLPGIVMHYDYVRASDTIRQDLVLNPGKQEQIRKAPEGLHVCGIQPAWFFMENQRLIAPAWDAETFHPFKYVLGAALHWPIDEATRIRVNGPCRKGEVCYTVARTGIYDAERRNLDLFYRDYEKGMRLLSAGNSPEALSTLAEAFRTRPFLFRYLAPEIPPDEFSRLSGRTTLELIYQLTWWINPEREFRFGLVKEEYLDYLRVVAAVAYLENENGLQDRSLKTLETLVRITTRKGEQVHPLYWGDVQRITEGIRDPQIRVRIRDFLIENAKVRAVPSWVKSGDPEEPGEGARTR